MSIRTSIGVGRALRGVADGYLAPARHTRGEPVPAVLMAPGRGNPTPASWLGHPAALAAAEHFVLAAVDLGGPCWGNDESCDRLAHTRAWASGDLGASTDRVAVWGISMGALTVLRWAALHPADVAGVVLVAPCLDLREAYGKHVAYRNEIDRAFGGRPWEYGYDRANPMLLAADGAFSRVPIQIWSGGKDELCPPATVARFVEAAGADVESHEVAGADHVQSLMSAVPASVVDFLERTLALAPA